MDNQPIKSRYCISCGVKQDLGNTYTQKSKSDKVYYQSQCKVCANSGRNKYKRPKYRRLKMPNVAGYSGRPCAYVRWLEDVDVFYVGFARHLLKRYNSSALMQVIYFEEFDTLEEAIFRESELIYDFVEAKLPLGNRKLGRRIKYIGAR